MNRLQDKKTAKAVQEAKELEEKQSEKEAEIAAKSTNPLDHIYDLKTPTLRTFFGSGKKPSDDAADLKKEI